MQTGKMLLDFAAQCGIPGVDDAINHAKTLLEPYGKVTVSPLGTVLCTVKEPEENGIHLLLDAHIDEIGMMVSFVEDNGFVRIARFGGTDARGLAANRVTIHTETGNINGVICSVPPHLSDDSKTDAVPTDESFVDTGLTTEQAKEKIRPGDRVSYQSPQIELLNGLVSSKALDDRTGCITLIKVLEELNGEIPFGLTVMFSAMEEVGGMGAETSAFAVKPTHALAVDVGFGSDGVLPAHKAVKLGSGARIGIAPILNREETNRLIDLAKANELGYTLEVMAGSTGTNADSIATSRGGIKTLLVSVPERYMHMPVEVVDPADIDTSAKLIALWIKDLAEREAR